MKNAEELAGDDFTLHDLEGCRVFLQGPMSALRMRRLRNCKVYAGPVAGASFVDGMALQSPGTEPNMCNCAYIEKLAESRIACCRYLLASYFQQDAH